MDGSLRNYLMESASFWRGKRVIVTGGVGFLGKPDVAKLQQRGAAKVTLSPRH